jgi:hypothetical protein
MMMLDDGLRSAKHPDFRAFNVDLHNARCNALLLCQRIDFFVSEKQWKHA